MKLTREEVQKILESERFHAIKQALDYRGCYTADWRATYARALGALAILKEILDERDSSLFKDII